MNQPLYDLKTLQAIDDQIGYWRAVATSGPLKLTAAREKLTSLEHELLELNKKMQDKKIRHRELETEIKDLADKKLKNQSRHLLAKTNEELHAMLKEGEHLDREIGLREDEALMLLDDLEKLEVQKPDLELLVSEEALIYSQKADEIEQGLADGRTQEKIILEERRQLSAALPPLLGDQYERLRKSRAGTAVSAVAGGMCQACRLSVPPQVFNELQRNNKVITCPNCNRIIYWADHPDFKEEKQSQA